MIRFGLRSVIPESKAFRSLHAILAIRIRLNRTEPALKLKGTLLITATIIFRKTCPSAEAVIQVQAITIRGFIKPVVMEGTGFVFIYMNIPGRNLEVPLFGAILQHGKNS
ncbi:hypothetical protein ASB62_09810 [Chlorobium limicola]|uniref:Uncharacterized protein n=1 Tax=Chlorobium limicola TaxID=1092 RepID=A0A101J4U3_CHLLI|nr:hypothetical protein ASB62_09810 [Chlorobium limicola]